ncbi:MAG TPA: adenosylcobalamin-dependent ribonucleoside-diphosphate reductase, partial [Rhizobiales bacterium]|nr:adenosylcobalamin-dependent ribonucleoside-diphosphate reductase [Hyphomicrobiales bacterium]
RKKWADRFFDIMSDYRFLPAGRILAGAGTKRSVTLFNCFVMGRAEDSISGIFDELKHAALAMQQGGGIGQDFSTIRPAGAAVEGVGADASGPVSFMHVWDAMCRTIMSAGSRRGAMMATLACDHPDIEAFVAAKRDGDVLQMFNLSVLVSDAFMAAVAGDDDWPLQFEGKVSKTVRARDLWHKIMQANYDSAEPGVIFIDRVNQQNNLSYCETIYATNPCGEQPLPSFGACLLGSVNLTRFVRQPFSDAAKVDEKLLQETVKTAVRMLDNVIDVSQFPLEQLAHEARSKRRIGLGLTGLADALAMCGIRYGSAEAVKMSGRWMALIEQAAYRASADIASEKGAFALFDKKQYLAAPNVVGLDKQTRRAIEKHGVRNALVTSIAPTGTISLFAGNVSSGVEPVFAYEYSRKILRHDGRHDVEMVVDYAVALFREMFGNETPLPDYFVAAHELSSAEHLNMQAALQNHVDSAISKTINCARDISFEDFEAIYRKAYELGLKGCTTYRSNSISDAVLSTEPAVHEEQTLLPLDAPFAMSGDQ